jgi:hypothetical protein
MEHPSICECSLAPSGFEPANLPATQARTDSNLLPGPNCPWADYRKRARFATEGLAVDGSDPLLRGGFSKGGVVHLGRSRRDLVSSRGLIAVSSSTARAVHKARAAAAPRADIMTARPRSSLASLGPRPARLLRIDDRDERATRL